jgi:hypothetical protein
MVFFMHDILGGTKPSARIVAGIVDNAAVTGQLPFAWPNGAVLPLNSGVYVNSGVAGAIDNNNIPFLGPRRRHQRRQVHQQQRGREQQRRPGLHRWQLPAGHHAAEAPLRDHDGGGRRADGGAGDGVRRGGPCTGFYITSSEDGVSQTVAVTAMFKEGGVEDTISFFGVHRCVDSESHLTIVGGTGKYVGAKGFAKVAVVRPGGVVASGALMLETDGVETVLQFTACSSIVYMSVCARMTTAGDAERQVHATEVDVCKCVCCLVQLLVAYKTSCITSY